MRSPSAEGDFDGVDGDDADASDEMRAPMRAIENSIRRKLRKYDNIMLNK